MKTTDFFSITKELIMTDASLPYTIYINSSTLEGKYHFVKITQKNNKYTTQDIAFFYNKYKQFYVHETDRSNFFKTLNKINQNYVLKTQLIKDITIHHLKNLFDSVEKTHLILQESIIFFGDSVNAMLDVIGNKNVNDIKDLIAKLTFHDSYTYDHSINVCLYTMVLYKTIHPQANNNILVSAGIAGLLHDIGKTKIPTSILNNAGKLTNEQYIEIKKHPIYGYEQIINMKESVKNDYCECIDFDLVSTAIIEHHENVNGTGYPIGKKGAEINEISKIVAIADFFDAITTKRSYHEALTISEALNVMKNSVDMKIDRNFFEIFEQSIKNENLYVRNLKVPDNFDPCQPHSELPLQSADNVNLLNHYKKKVS